MNAEDGPMSFDVLSFGVEFLEWGWMDVVGLFLERRA